MTGLSVPAFLDSLARRYGMRPAIVAPDETIAFADLPRRVARVAGGLASLGIGPGDRIALWLPNSPAWLDLSLACAHVGAIAVAVNTRFRAAEVEDIVGRSGARVLALWPGFRRIDFLSILADVPAAALDRLETLVLIGDGSEAGTALPGRFGDKRIVRYTDLSGASPPASDAAGPDVGCNIFTTSGTTRAPKFVLHPQKSVTAHAVDVARGFGFDDRDAVMYQALPFCGVFGFSQAMGSLASGNPTILPETFDAEEAADALTRHRVTHMNGADEMFRLLLEARPRSDLPFPHLRRCGFAAFNAEPEAVVAMGDARGLPLVGLYGMSELQALFAARDPADPPEERALGGGRLVSRRARVRVRDPDTGRILPPGEPGEIEATGPSRMAAYFENEEATREGLTEDGYVRTGDLGYTTEDGFVFQARMGDAIRLGGFLVNPVEISSFVEALPGVAACQVVGVPGERGTEVAAFVLEDGPGAVDTDAALAACRAGMARYKVPRAIYIIDAFPVTDSANGVKIQRSKLRDMAARLSGRS